MTLKRWPPPFPAFPPGGLLASETVGSPPGPATAAAGGLLAGAVIGAGQWLALRNHGIDGRWPLFTAAAMTAGAALAAGAPRGRPRGPGPLPPRPRARGPRGAAPGPPPPQPHLGRGHGGRLGAGVAGLRRRARPAGGRGLRRIRRQRRAGRHRADGPGAPPRGARMSVAGLVLIVLPVAFNVTFGMLAARFDYPDVLRRPTHEVLARFREGGRSLVLLWWAFALTALALAPAVVLLSSSIGDADGTLLAVGTVTGVLAALVQLLGLIRWPFLVPYLARVAAEPDASETRQEAVDIVFQAFNRYLGVAVGEHLGYLLTGAWTTLAGVALTQTTAAPTSIGVLGIVIGPVLALCSLEFLGGREAGWKVAERLTPVAYVAWSLWLVATGVAVL